MTSRRFPPPWSESLRATSQGNLVPDLNLRVISMPGVRYGRSIDAVRLTVGNNANRDTRLDHGGQEETFKIRRGGV